MWHCSRCAWLLGKAESITPQSFVDSVWPVVKQHSGNAWHAASAAAAAAALCRAFFLPCLLLVWISGMQLLALGMDPSSVCGAGAPAV